MLQQFVACRNEHVARISQYGPYVAPPIIYELKDLKAWVLTYLMERQFDDMNLVINNKGWSMFSTTTMKKDMQISTKELVPAVYELKKTDWIKIEKTNILGPKWYTIDYNKIRELFKTYRSTYLELIDNYWMQAYVLAYDLAYRYGGREMYIWYQNVEKLIDQGHLSHQVAFDGTLWVQFNLSFWPAVERLLQRELLFHKDILKINIQTYNALPTGIFDRRRIIAAIEGRVSLAN